MINQKRMPRLRVLRKLQKRFEVEDEALNSPVRNDAYSKKIYEGNPLFGNCAIPRHTALFYIQILSNLFEHPDFLTAAQIGTLKGMINRCIRHDQKD